MGQACWPMAMLGHRSEQLDDLSKHQLRFGLLASWDGSLCRGKSPPHSIDLTEVGTKRACPSLPPPWWGRGRNVTIWFFPNFFLYIILPTTTTPSIRVYMSCLLAQKLALSSSTPHRSRILKKSCLPNPDASAMPPPIDLEPFREDIQRRILIQKQSQKEILSWLTGHDVICTRMTVRAVTLSC